MTSPNSKSYLFSKGVDQYLTGVYDGYAFTARFFKEVFKPPIHFSEIINQCFEIGLKSLGLITVTGLLSVLFLPNNRARH